MASELEVAICISGDECGEEAVESTTFPGTRRFCEKHQVQLDGVAAAMRDRTFKVSAQNKEDVKHTYCATPGCPNRPIYTQDYCAECNGE